MRRLALLLALLTTPAAAQPAPAAYPGPGTLLRLSESAEVTRLPDETRASLRVEAREATAAAAQSAVNRAMAAALASARAVPGVTPSTGGYASYRDSQTGRWNASQALLLRGEGGGAMLDLVGDLQGRGLAMNGLTQTLTRDATRTARQEAASLALDALKRRAEAIAEQMGMRVERIAEVRIGGDAPRGRPMMGEAALARAAPASPVTASDDVVIGASVEAAVILAPR